jgi:hypothetical protein
MTFFPGGGGPMPALDGLSFGIDAAVTPSKPAA